MDEKRDPNVFFAFDHKIFSFEGAYFRLTHDTKEPCFYVNLGEMKGAIPTKSLCKEFGIEDESSDAQLLSTVGRALKYVREIRPNDSIPKELLDGSASWSIEDRHKEIARGRITMQVLSWLKGNEGVVLNLNELEEISNDPQTKEKVQEAFREIAVDLGVRREDVVAKIDEVVRELAYIEALREHYAKIKKISTNLNRLAVLYKRDRATSDDIGRMQVLIDPVIRKFDRNFIDIDAQTCEVMVILRNFQPTVVAIRKTRDKLHQHFMVWHEILDKWKSAIIEESQEIERLLRETYQFLARNYMQSQSWRLGGV
ncbi:hypothetical protein J0X12_13595 [Sneathiella sp. CAU 1612]|jgi:hypothetical protein|uniref:Uncharacterized protein n=1 Tax=Sneathiella sedimenti TaxID=2816034 RepID=A0ABS3F807_9PROT|nr:hypothetical protein [Sneathiella sedimenti]MBO0334656.1 hypothetical protein [Sneathiella sedimenti]